MLRAIPAGGGYKVEPLGPAVNGKTASGKAEEFDPFVAPDESYLIFASFGRPDSLGSADLYVSFRVNGKWQPARSLGPSVNSKAFEYCPIVSPDGRHLFFTSYRKPEAGTPGQPATVEQLIASFDEIENGMGNIYWMKSDFLEAMRRERAPSPD